MKLYLFIITLMLSCIAESKEEELTLKDLLNCHLALVGEVKSGKDLDFILPNKIFWGDFNERARLEMMISKNINKTGDKALVFLSDQKKNNFRKLIFYMSNNKFDIDIKGVEKKALTLTELSELMENLAKEFEAQKSKENR